MQLRLNMNNEHVLSPCFKFNILCMHNKIGKLHSTLQLVCMPCINWRIDLFGCKSCKCVQQTYFTLL